MLRRPDRSVAASTSRNTSLMRQDRISKLILAASLLGMILSAPVWSTGAQPGTPVRQPPGNPAGADHGRDRAAWRDSYTGPTKPCPGKSLTLPERGLRLQLEEAVAKPSRRDTVCDVLTIYRTESRETTRLGGLRLNSDHPASPDFLLDFRFDDYTPRGAGIVVLRKAKGLRLYFVDESRLSEMVSASDCEYEDARSTNLEKVILLENGAWLYATATSCKPMLIDTSNIRARFGLRADLGPLVVFASSEVADGRLLVVDAAGRSLRVIPEHRHRGPRYSVAYFLNTRGMQAYRMGDLRRAGEWFSLAAEVAPPEFVVPHTNLAAALALDGRREKSLAKLREACALDPGFTRPRMLNDDDYAGLRDDPAFRDILRGPCRAPAVP